MICTAYKLSHMGIFQRSNGSRTGPFYHTSLATISELVKDRDDNDVVRIFPECFFMKFSLPDSRSVACKLHTPKFSCLYATHLTIHLTPSLPHLTLFTSTPHPNPPFHTPNPPCHMPTLLPTCPTGVSLEPAWQWWGC